MGRFLIPHLPRFPSTNQSTGQNAQKAGGIPMLKRMIAVAATLALAATAAMATAESYTIGIT